MRELLFAAIAKIHHNVSINEFLFPTNNSSFDP